MNQTSASRAGSLVLLLAALTACGGGSSGDDTATATPGASTKTSHTIDELNAQSRRALKHHTVYAELIHPDAGTPSRSRIVLPYHFDTPTRQKICLDTVNPASHRIEVYRVGTTEPALAVITDEQNCQNVQFSSGDYDIVIQHGGGGAVDESTHVFAHAGFTPSDPSSAFGRLLLAQGAANAGTAEERRQIQSASASPCNFVETVALYDKKSRGYLQTNVGARSADPFELRDIKVPGLIATVDERHGPSALGANTMIDVYACGDRLKFKASGGAFLKSSCGYALFSAAQIDDATEYLSHWDPERQRLDLVNAETGTLLKVTQRSAGRVVNPATWKNYPTQPALGTCDTFPNELRSPPAAPFSWVSVSTNEGGPPPYRAATTARPHDALFMGEYSDDSFVANFQTDYFFLTEFAHLPNPQGRFGMVGRYAWPNASATSGVADTADRRRRIQSVTDAWEDSWVTNVVQDDQGLQFVQVIEAYDVGPSRRRTFSYPDDIDSEGGLIPSHQDVLVLSFGSCQKCDLTGMDLSNRKAIRLLDLTGSIIANAKFTNTQVQTAYFDNAKISGTDFTGTQFDSSSFDDASITSSTFARAVLHATGYTTSFVRTTISGTEFTDTDLSNTHFTQSKISALTTFTGGSLAGASFDRSTLTDVNFVIAQAPGALFTNAKLTSVKLSYANLKGASFKSSNIVNSNFSYAFVVGSDFSATSWSGTQFENVQAYSDGASNTVFDNCTIAGGSFANSKFMQTSFSHCRLQGGSFAGSEFVAASFNAAVAEADANGQTVSFTDALLAGANFGNATLSSASLIDSIISSRSGAVDLRILTQPYRSEADPGVSVTRTYTYQATVKPASTSASTTCPNAAPGPCLTDTAWKALSPPFYAGHEDPDSW